LAERAEHFDKQVSVVELAVDSLEAVELAVGTPVVAELAADSLEAVELAVDTLEVAELAAGTPVVEAVNPAVDTLVVEEADPVVYPLEPGGV
jgi:acyl carrier protein